MKKIKLQTLVIYALAVLSGVALLYTSQSVQKAEDRLAAIDRAAENEIEAIRVLKAEWAYLNNPERLEKLADEFLALEPPNPSRLIVEPSILPDPHQETIYQEISTGAMEEAAAAPDVPAPPAPPVRSQVKSEKSFNTLLDELDQEGGQ